MEEIINLYEEIWEISCELKLLELQGRNNDECFKKLVDEFKKCLVLERKLIDRLVKDYGYDYDKIVDMILNSKDIIDDSVRKRMYDSVTLYKLLYDERLNINDGLSRMNKLYNSCFKNMYLMYFSFLQEFIDREIDGNKKLSLLDLKYYESYFNHDMESVLVLNNFNVPVDNYIDLDIANQLANLSNGMDEVLANYVDIILGIVCEILDVNDSSYDDNVELVRIVKNQCMFRACLSLISEDELKMISEEINRIINSKNNGSNKNSVKLINSINSIINMRMRDKERVRRLSLMK